MSPSSARRWLGQQGDARLATLVGRGDAAAFEALYHRHHASLLAFCRHMLGSREDGEEALQQTFLRAHRALSSGRPPATVRPWLFAIARNRCRTMLAARRDTPVRLELPEVGFDDLAEQVRRRAELRELIADLGRLAEDQRAALMLAELGDLSHNEIGAVLGCPPKKVKALVFQAREALIADRDARCIPCAQIRSQLETATGNLLRRASLRRHLRQCAPCDAYRLAVRGRSGGLGALLPVAPTAGLKGAVLGAAGLWGGSESASAAVAGLTFKAVVAKIAVTAAVAGAGVSGGLAVTEDPAPAPLPAAPEAAASVERAKPERSRTRGARARPTPAAVAETPASSVSATPVRQQRARRVRAMRRHLVRSARRQARAARRLRRPAVRRARSSQARPRLRLRPRARRRARLRSRPPALPAPTAEPTPTPEATAEPAAEPAPPPLRPRRARRQLRLDDQPSPLREGHSARQRP